MVNFQLKDSDNYYLCLSEQPKRFDADSPATNVFFDDTNGQVFTVRSGGVTGVTVSSMDETKSTSFRMEDRGPIISIKLSPDQNILAIQRNQDNQNATVEFVNFKDLAPTNVEYSHTCKWKNAKILGFVWPKVNEIAFITDHGIELLQVVPEKKQLRSLKHTTFSGAWFSWCAQSNIVLLAGNNGTLLQPFSLNNSTIAKLQKLELEAGRPCVERDVFVVRVYGVTWCAVFRHAAAAHGVGAPLPTEVWLMPISGGSGHQHTHILKTGLSGRFAVSIVDNLLVVHHQSSQTSQIFDILEEAKVEGTSISHAAVLAGASIRPAFLDRQPCPMSQVRSCMEYCCHLWDGSAKYQLQALDSIEKAAKCESDSQMKGSVAAGHPDSRQDVNPLRSKSLQFAPNALPIVKTAKQWNALPLSVFPATYNLGLFKNKIPKEDISKVVAVILRRSEAIPSMRETLYRILNQLVVEAKLYLLELSSVFDEINSVYRSWADQEVARNTAGADSSPATALRRIVLSQPDVCTHVLQPREDTEYIVQAVCAYLGSLTRHAMVVQHATGELTVRALLTRNAAARLRALARQGALGDSRPLACAFLSLGHLHTGAPQLALDMMTRGDAYQDIIEVLLSWNDPISAIGVARTTGNAWSSIPARKLLAVAGKCPPHTFVAVMHALMARNERYRGSPNFLKSEQCDGYVERYKEIMEQQII